MIWRSARAFVDIFRSSDDPIIFVCFGVLSAHSVCHAKNRCVPNIDTVVGDLVALRFCILLYGIGKRPGMCGDNFGCPCDPIIFRCFGPQQSIVSKYRYVPNIGTLVVTSSATCYSPSTHVARAAPLPLPCVLPFRPALPVLDLCARPRRSALTARAPQSGYTPLHWAASNRHPEVARVLLEANADVNARDKVRVGGRGSTGRIESPMQGEGEGGWVTDPNIDMNQI